MSTKKDDGVRAVNQEFTRYDQVDKTHTYRLADTGEDAFDESFELPTCDMSQFLAGGDAGKVRFAEELGASLEEIGFACLVGHPVEEKLYSDAEAQVAAVFTQPTLAEKMHYRAARCGSVSQGYFPIKETSDIHPDLVEGWVFCRRAFDLAQDDRSRAGSSFDARAFWPRPALEPVFRRVALANEQLILPITQSIFRYLGCDPHAYDAKLAGANFGLRLNYYPPIGAEDDASGAGRLLGHEDVDLFTILPAPSVEGLQAWHREREMWVRIDAPAGSIIINTGDYMQRITNDRLRSTTHRVSKPRDGTHRSAARISIPMAVYVGENEQLEVLPGLGKPKYPPIKAITFHTRTTSKFYGDDYAVE